MSSIHLTSSATLVTNGMTFRNILADALKYVRTQEARRRLETAVATGCLYLPDVGPTTRTDIDQALRAVVASMPSEPGEMYLSARRKLGLLLTW